MFFKTWKAFFVALRKAVRKGKGLSQEQREFLSHVVELQKVGGGEFLIEWLESERARLVPLFEGAVDVPTLRLAQGRADALRDLLATARNAETTLDADTRARGAVGKLP